MKANILGLAPKETEAILYLAEHETCKIAAENRGKPLNTENKQINIVKEKWGTYSQIGLMKELFKRLYGIEFSLEEAMKIIGSSTIALLMLVCSILGNPGDQRTCRRMSRRRADVEQLILES